MDYGTSLVCGVTASLIGVLVCPVRARPLLLLLGSYLFLATWSEAGLGVLILITALAYFSGLAVEARPSRLVVGCAVGLILIPLLLLKFRMFPLEFASPHDIGSGTIFGGKSGSSPFGPFGLSFFTLQAVSYILDIRWSGAQAQRQFVPLALYLAFFPKLLAGPIERAGAFISQLRAIRLPEARGILYAAKCILLGLFSKFVLADSMADIREELSRAQTGGGVVAVACAVYSYEIYLDFFAYSMIAIGVGKVLGIELSDNFRTPYAAPTLRDFWRRWHMTLSFWFRDYLYKPLGGRRGSESRRWVIVILVFVCSGLWHGSAWAFVAWGGIHGASYLVGTSTLSVRRRVWSALGLARVPQLHSFLQTTFVFVAVSLAWIPFRSEGVTDALVTLGRVVGLRGAEPYWSLGDLRGRTLLLACGLLAVVMLMDLSRMLERFPRRESMSVLERVGELVAIDGMILLLLLVGDNAARSFTYFEF